MKQDQVRALYTKIFSLFMCCAAIGTMPVEGAIAEGTSKTAVANEAMLQQQRAWRAEKARDIAHLGDQLRSLINPLTDVLKNKKIIPEVKRRKQAIAWVQAINEQTFKVVDKLRIKTIPIVDVLKESAVILALHIDALYDGLMKQLPLEALVAVAIDKDARAQKLSLVQARVEGLLKKTLEEQRASGMKNLPDTIDADMIDTCIVEQFIVALEEGLTHLADLVHEYGITKINRAARFMDKLVKGITYNAYMPYFVVPAFFGGVGLVTLLLWQMRDRNQEPMLLSVVMGSLGMALQKFGGDIFNYAWAITRPHLNEIGNRMTIMWRKMQGLPVKETINGFDILKPEDCEGEEEPLIGLEIPFGRVMGSIQSALNRMQTGDREPLKGIQRTYIFTGAAGAGKTFCMEQLKIRIAQFNLLGMKIAFENIQGEKLAYGDLIARIKEAMQQNIGLILWIDEMHLYKPMKDGNTPLLSQLLQTEFINKSNTPIWIFTATNEPGRFDNALIRAGRFEVINIYEPMFQDRIRLFDYYLRQQGMVLSLPELRLFAAQTQQCQPAVIRKVINTARSSGQALTRELIQAQILQTVFKVVPGFELLQGKEQREVAAYQSGKLLVHVLNALDYSPSARKQFFGGERFALCTAAAVEKSPKELAAFALEPVVSNINLDKGARRIFGKLFTYTGREDGHGSHMRRHEKELLISELLAGACAQEMYLKDSVDDMKRDDFKLAFEYCLDIELDGVPANALSKADEQRCRKAALERFIAAKERARVCIDKHQAVCKEMINFMLQFKEFPHITALNVLMLLEEMSKQDNKEEVLPRSDISNEATSEPVTLTV